MSKRGEITESRMAKDYAALYGSQKPQKAKRAKRSKSEISALRKTAGNASHPQRTEALAALRDTRGVSAKSYAKFVSK